MSAKLVTPNGNCRAGWASPPWWPARAPAMPDSELTKLTERRRHVHLAPMARSSSNNIRGRKAEYDHIYEFWAFDAKHEHGVVAEPRRRYGMLQAIPPGFSLQPPTASG